MARTSRADTARLAAMIGDPQLAAGSARADELCAGNHAVTWPITWRHRVRRMTFARRLLAIPAAAALIAAAAASPSAAAVSAPSGFTVTTFASAPTTIPATTGPDDVAGLGGHVFVGWQNGVGTMGEPNPTTGQTTGTVIEYDRSGHALQSWSLTGKVDGLGGDPERHVVIATVNEDGNSSLYTIDPRAPAGSQVQHYTYSPAPDSAATGGSFTGGGTDAVVVHQGSIFVSASNPGSASATAVFRVVLHPGSGIASLKPTFADNASATDAVSGHTVTLALTDPDSNADVPDSSPRFSDQFVLDSQGDQQLIFARRMVSDNPELTRLSLTHGGQSAGVDDIRWSSGSDGTLIVVDSKAATVYAVTGPFTAGEAFGSLDTVGTAAQNNEVDTINLGTGELSPFLTGLETAKGLLWLPGGSD